MVVLRKLNRLCLPEIWKLFLVKWLVDLIFSIRQANFEM